jgi:hypothetical protein
MAQSQAPDRTVALPRTEPPSVKTALMQCFMHVRVELAFESMPLGMTLRQEGRRKNVVEYILALAEKKHKFVHSSHFYAVNLTT